jgi:hypothetical protein
MSGPADAVAAGVGAAAGASVVFSVSMRGAPGSAAPGRRGGLI